MSAGGYSADWSSPTTSPSLYHEVAELFGGVAGLVVRALLFLDTDLDADERPGRWTPTASITGSSTLLLPRQLRSDR